MSPIGACVSAFPLLVQTTTCGCGPRPMDRSKEKAMKRGAILPLSVLFLITAGVAAAPCGAAPPMVEKNLFSQDRKPPSPDAATAPAQANKPSLSLKSVQLDGIIVFGNTRKALVRMKSGGKPAEEKGKRQSPYVVVSEGGLLGDYRVTKVDVKSITLEKDGQSIVVSLFAEGKVSPPVPAAPATPSQAAQGQAVPGRGRGPGAPPRGGRPEPGHPGAAARVNVHGGEAAGPAVGQQAEQQEDSPGDENVSEEEAQTTEGSADEESP